MALNGVIMQTWILTFNRPLALNRLIETLGRQGIRSNIFSNHPDVYLSEESEKYVDKIIKNTLNSPESNSWCARSWNTIMMKAFEEDNELVCIQDDTAVTERFAMWLETSKQKYDFIWGPAGDQFFFTRFDVLKATGWWDERYIGCYCGDADWMKRVFHAWDKDRISVVDTHDWGFVHNDCGIQYIINTHAKGIDPNYENQNEELQRKAPATMICAQQHFISKWGRPLNGTGPVNQNDERLLTEIEWYPWFSSKHGFGN